MSALLPDKNLIKRFVEVLFRHADEDTWVNFRAFEHESDKAVHITDRSVKLNGVGLGVLAAKAYAAATGVALHKNPAVFCPPVATFSRRFKASENDLANGLVLSLELDEQPSEGLRRIVALLGRPTMVVQSGGEWADPATGELQPKLHAYWRLNEPTRTAEDHARLKRLRKLATDIAGGDGTNITAVHPIRWAGSVHNKQAPRLARIVEENETEIDLADASETLEQAAPARARKAERAANANGEADPRATADLLLKLADLIPNDGVHWDEWNAMGLRFYCASGGSEDGFRAFDAWSKKAERKYDEDETRNRWEHFDQYPPDRTGLNKLIREAKKADPKFQTEENQAKADKLSAGRHEIRLSDEHRNAVMADCAKHLRDVVFMRSTVPIIVAQASDLGGKPVSDDDGDAVDLGGVRHRPGSLLFVEPNPELVKWHLDDRILFRRYVRREKEWLPTDCPKDLVAGIIGAATKMGFHHSSGIVNVPLLLEGKIVATTGYNKQTGLILDIAGLKLNVPDNPSKEQAEAALERLLAPFRGYLKNGAVRREAIAAAAMTAVLRPSLDQCPAILIDGNAPGVGKGKLARALGALNTASIPAIVTEGHNDEETEKRIATAVLQGAPAILFDNLQRHVASSTLESLLTEPVADIRVFGKLASLRVACRALLMMTANNASLRQDVLRRCLPARIQVRHASPETRKFGFDPAEEAAKDRSGMIEAAFTIAIAWQKVKHLDENKKHRQALGSFEQWADVVADPIAWLTDSHPVALIKEKIKEDGLRDDDRLVFDDLLEKYGAGEGFYAKDAAKNMGRKTWGAALKLKADQEPSASAVGRWLRARKGRVFGDYILDNDVDRDGVAKWHVERITCANEGEESAGDEGDCGGCPTRPCEKWQKDKNGTYAKSEIAGAAIPRHPPHPPQPEPGFEEFEL